jgi:hypothetical protein
MVLGQLDERESATVRGELERALEGLKTNGGYDMPGVCINGLGARP